MRSRHLGCLTAWGVLAILLTLLIVVGVGLARGGVLFSPGELSQQNAAQPLGGVFSHAEIEGNCAACHAAPWSRATMADRCLDCHSTIKTDGKLHITMLEDGIANCRSCHPEHRGPQAELTLVDLHDFPHEVIGYSLKGHQQMPNGRMFNCEDCHGQDVRSFDQNVCELCHVDIQPDFIQAHADQFGRDCLACHDGVDQYGSDFDHARLTFPLTGQHTNLLCTDCHAGAKSPAALQNAPQQCVECHREDDPHQVQSWQDCAVCHTTDGWSDAVFDHSQTAFPLTGGHVRVKCQGCHENRVFRGTPTDCFSCHAEDDAHQGGFGQDCAACHTTDSWPEAVFDGPHTFPIDHGENGPSRCQVCHPDQLQSYSCYGCHAHNPVQIENKHREEGITNFSDCARCHPTGREEEGEHGGERDDD